MKGDWCLGRAPVSPDVDCLRRVNTSTECCLVSRNRETKINTRYTTMPE